MRSLIDFDWKWFFLRLYERSFETDLFNRAAQVAFYFSFSLFPFLLFLVSVFGLILESTDTLRRELFAYFARILPSSAFELVRTTVNEVSQGSTGGKITIGILITLWSASAAVDSIRSALNAVYNLPETRFWGKVKLQSLALTVLVVILVALVLTFFFIGWRLVQIGLAGAGLQVTSPLVLVSIQWIAVILVLLFACEVIYNLLPNFKVHKWIWITPGSVVAILVWIALTSGFRLYLLFSDSYSRTYGSLGAVIILMFWLYLTSVALLFGGLINAVLAERVEQKKLTAN
ncbi:MAG TPA: YihY/virulence factor BrkB family protein [Pyrinomonadaceae bacterium]|jgi:membrane protein|nr:YihY/virulence factor BrkB family protein [Pyrinomonadaceae bacterium]